MISTISPLASAWVSGTMRPLTLAPRQRCPREVCTLVGKIQRRRPARQIDHLALGGEHVDAVLEELAAHALEQVAVGIRAVRAVLRLQQPPHPFDLALVLRIARRRPPCRSSARRRRARRARACRGCGSAPRRSAPAGRSPRCGSSGSRCPWGSRCSHRTRPGCRATGRARCPAPHSTSGIEATTMRTARTSNSCSKASCLRCILR